MELLVGSTSPQPHDDSHRHHGWAKAVNAVPSRSVRLWPKVRLTAKTFALVGALLAVAAGSVWADSIPIDDTEFNSLLPAASYVITDNFTQSNTGSFPVADNVTFDNSVLTLSLGSELSLSAIMGGTMATLMAGTGLFRNTGGCELTVPASCRVQRGCGRS